MLEHYLRGSQRVSCSDRIVTRRRQEGTIDLDILAVCLQVIRAHHCLRSLALSRIR